MPFLLLFPWSNISSLLICHRWVSTFFLSYYVLSLPWQNSLFIFILLIDGIFHDAIFSFAFLHLHPSSSSDSNVIWNRIDNSAGRSFKFKARQKGKTWSLCSVRDGKNRDDCEFRWKYGNKWKGNEIKDAFRVERRTV